MQKIPRAEEAAEKKSSSDCLRPKYIPRHLVRTCYQVAITTYGQTCDGGFLLAIEAGTKLEPRRFFALVVVVLGER